MDAEKKEVDWIKPIEDFRRFAVYDCRVDVDGSKTIRHLENHLTELIKIFESFKDNENYEAREAYARAFRFLLFRPLPHQLDQRIFKGSLKILWINIRLDKDCGGKEDQLEKTIWISLRVINRLFDLYALPENSSSQLTKEHENQRSYITTKFVSLILFTLSELIKIWNHKPEGPLTINQNHIFSSIVQLLDKTITIRKLSQSYMQNITLRLIRATNNYIDRCFKHVKVTADNYRSRSRYISKSVNKSRANKWMKKNDDYDYYGNRNSYNYYYKCEKVYPRRLATLTKAKKLIKFLLPQLDSNFMQKIFDKLLPVLEINDAQQMVCLSLIIRDGIDCKKEFNMEKLDINSKVAVICEAYLDFGRPMLSQAQAEEALEHSREHNTFCGRIVLNNLLKGGHKFDKNRLVIAVGIVDGLSLNDMLTMQTVIRLNPEVTDEICREVLQKIMQSLSLDSDLKDYCFWLNVMRIRTLSCYVSGSEHLKPDQLMVDENLLTLIVRVFESTTSNLLHKEALELLTNISKLFIDEYLWHLIPQILERFLSLGQCYLTIHFQNIMKFIYNLITLEPERFIAEEENLESVCKICSAVLSNRRNKKEDIDLRVAKLIEIIILQYEREADEFLPILVESIVVRLQRRVRKDRLEKRLLLTLVAALYINSSLLLNIFEELEKKEAKKKNIELKPQIMLNSFIKRWFSGIKKYKSIHTLRLNFVGICALISLPADRRSQVSSLIEVNALSIASRLYGGLIDNDYAKKGQKELFQSRFDTGRDLADYISLFQLTIRQLSESDQAWYTRLTKKKLKRPLPT